MVAGYAGSIRVDGQQLSDLPDAALYRRTTVGFVFQLHHLLPALTALVGVGLGVLGALISVTQVLRVPPLRALGRQ